MGKSIKFNILHITTNHSAFDDRIFFKQARSLCEIGNVSILSYSKDCNLRDMSGQVHSSGIYEGVNQQTLVKPIIKGSLLSKAKKFFGIVFNHSKYSHWSEKIKFDILDFIVSMDQKPNIIHIHEPGLLSTALALKNKLNCKIIYDAHELELLYTFDKPLSKLKNLYNFFQLKKNMKDVLPYFDATISVNNYVRTSLLMMAPFVKHHTIQNSSLFEAKNEGLDSKIILVHEGSLIFNRGLKLMVDMFNDSWIRDNVILKIIGKIGKEEEAYFSDILKEKPYLNECINMTGWVKYLDVESHLRGCHMGIIFMEPNYNNLIGSPNKLYNYLACCLPVISVDLAPTTDLINSHKLGLVIDRNVKSLKNAIHEIASHYNEYLANITASKDYFLWSTEEIKLKKIYLDLLSESDNDK